MGLIDTTIALRILYLLNTPFKSWPAYKEGFIDEDGERTDKEGESKNWGMLQRLIARIKRIIAIAPGGKSLLGTLTASYLLMKENTENFSDEELLYQFDVTYNNLNEDIMKEMSEKIQLNEEGEGAAPTGVSSIPITTDKNPPSPPQGSKKLKNPGTTFKDVFRRRLLEK